MCNRVIRRSPDNYDLTVTLGHEGKFSQKKVWPDNMRFGAAPWLVLLSEKAVDIFTRANITGFIPHKIKITATKTKNMDEISYSARLEELDKINYYVLEITGKGKIDWKKMGVELLSYCEHCGAKEFKERKNTYPEAFIDEGTWDGSDIFGYGHCTVKVLETVYKEQLTGFEFRYGIDSLNSLEQRTVDLKALFGDNRKRAAKNA